MILTAALLALTGCAAPSPSIEPQALDVRKPDPDILRPCDGPTPAVDGVLHDPVVQERVWTSDRVRLRRCADRHGQAVSWIEGVLVAVQGAAED